MGGGGLHAPYLIYMLVSDMLNHMSLLSVGPDIAPQSVRSIYLKYLNLAHFQLYNETALVNDDLMIDETLTTVYNEPTNTQMVSLSQLPLNISKVYYSTNRKFLEKKCKEDFFVYKSEINIGNSPKIYTSTKGLINIFPFINTDTYDLDFLYTPQPFNLTEFTEEEDIPYPFSYQGYLVDGALYYLFQDEEGFRSTQKNVQHQQIWNLAKINLYGDLINRSNKEIRTFSNA
jgi:hypothetical protein